MNTNFPSIFCNNIKNIGQYNEKYLKHKQKTKSEFQKEFLKNANILKPCNAIEKEIIKKKKKNCEILKRHKTALPMKWCDYKTKHIHYTWPNSSFKQKFDVSKKMCHLFENVSAKCTKY